MGLVTSAVKAGTLTEALRQRTSDLHTTAERSGVINDILRKKADRRGYSLLLRNVVPAYRTLEQALERYKHRPIFRAFARPELYRASALGHDLTALNDEHWEHDLPALPAATLYAARVSEAAEGDGARLVAHAYVRYFGDLSGGQILKDLLGKTLELQPEALTFYEFPGIDDPSAFKSAMRQAIDCEVAAVCDPEEVIEEALCAFEHNIAVSKAVQDYLASNP